MSIQGVDGASNNNQYPKMELFSNEEDSSSNNSIWAKFSDQDNIVDLSDVTYVANGNEVRSSEDIRKFLELHKGESWTDSLKNEITQLVARFNLECEGDELLDDVDNLLNNSTKIKVAKSSTLKAPTTGDLVSIQNEDGTSYQLNSKDKTLLKYSADGQLIYKRALTLEEKSMSTQQLMSHIKNSGDNAEKVKQAPKRENATNTTTGTISGDGIRGTYQLIDDENGGYKLETNFTISSQNQAMKAFLKGLTSEFGIANVKPDKNGYFNYRGLKAGSYNALYAMARAKAQDIAAQTAIYKDLKSELASGNELSNGEQKFMQDYQKLLSSYGLRLNDSGEIEDI